MKPFGLKQAQKEVAAVQQQLNEQEKEKEKKAGNQATHEQVLSHKRHCIHWQLCHELFGTDADVAGITPNC